VRSHLRRPLPPSAPTHGPRCAPYATPTPMPPHTDRWAVNDSVDLPPGSCNECRPERRSVGDVAALPLQTCVRTAPSRGRASAHRLPAMTAPRRSGAGRRPKREHLGRAPRRLSYPRPGHQRRQRLPMLTDAPRARLLGALARCSGSSSHILHVLPRPSSGSPGRVVGTEGADDRCDRGIHTRAR